MTTTTVCRSQGRKERRNRGTPEAYDWAEGERWGENAGIGETALCFVFAVKVECPVDYCAIMTCLLDCPPSYLNGIRATVDSPRTSCNSSTIAVVA